NFFDGELMIGRTAEKQLALEFLPLITVDELNRDVRSLSGADNRVIMISAPDGQPLPTRERVLGIVVEVEKEQIPKWEEKALPDGLMSKTPAPGKIVGE